MWKSGLLARLGIAVGGTVRSPSSSRSWLPASTSASAVWVELVPMVSTILFTYWCRFGSLACDQAGFLVKTIVLFGIHWLIWYGPSDSRCWPSCALAGR